MLTCNRFCLTVLIPFCLCVAAPVHADRALIVGVQGYPGLSAAAKLQGSLNDIAAMNTALEKCGFKVTVVPEEKATLQGIKAAFARVASESRANERFVFYFAGHGVRNPAPAILPYDALDKDVSFNLTRDMLRNLVLSIPARTRTVILDCCFSGGLAKSIERVLPGARSRFYEQDDPRFKGAKSPGFDPNGQDSNSHLGASGESICYYAASLGNERANETQIDGKEQGIFTHFLSQTLLSSPNRSWSDLHQSVQASITKLNNDEDLQHPVVSPPTFLGYPVFDISPTAAPGAARIPLWDEFNASRADPNKMSLRIKPEKTAFIVGEYFTLDIAVGEDGYLVVLDRDATGRIFLVYPANADVEAARISSGKTLHLPATTGSPGLWLDKAGSDHMKAILFRSKVRAKSLLDQFPTADSFVSLEGARRIREAPPDTAEFFTSSLVFEALPRTGTSR